MKYRKRPIEVEAYEFRNRVGEDTRPQWIIDAVARGEVKFNDARTGPPWLTIQTREGVMRAEIGDFIIRETFATDDRKLYPCKPDIFAATYEPAN